MQTMQNEFRYNSLKGKPFYYTSVILALVFQFNLHLTNFISSYQLLGWLCFVQSGVKLIILTLGSHWALQQSLHYTEIRKLGLHQLNTAFYHYPLDKKYLHEVCTSIISGTYQIMSLLATIRAQTNKGTGVTGLYHMPSRP